MSKIYSKFLKNIVMPIADMAMNTNIIKYYNEIPVMQAWSKKDIESWQAGQLTMLINYAYNNTLYYKQLFDKNDIKPDDIKSFKDLTKLPILTKNDIRDHYDILKPKNIDSLHYQKTSTGGSTGDPLVYLLDNKSWSFSTANMIVNWEKVGYRYGDKYIALGSTSLFVAKDNSLAHTVYYRLKNKIGLNGINMSNEVCKDYIQLIQKQKIKFIYGYASAIYLLAKYVLQNNIQLNISACMPTSEVLTDVYRDAIKNAFECRILNVYGANDGGITAFEQNEGFFEVGYNTIVTSIETNDGSSKVLLTDTLNFAMPLINYEIGDEAIIDIQNNKLYGFNGQVLNRVLGRTSDIIELENGNILTGPGFTILFKDIPIEHYYIEKSDKNTIKCTLNKLPEYDKSHEEIIYSTLRKQMGEGTNIDIQYSEEIRLSKSGKRKYFA
jgi:phenylacetate-CoA ligase